jgi:hypothetical protein
MDAFLEAMEGLQDTRRAAEFAAMSAIELRDYHDRIEYAIVCTPEAERPIMARFDLGELEACNYEMHKRRLSVHKTWQIGRPVVRPQAKPRPTAPATPNHWRHAPIKIERHTGD